MQPRYGVTAHRPGQNVFTYFLLCRKKVQPDSDLPDSVICADCLRVNHSEVPECVLVVVVFATRMYVSTCIGASRSGMLGAEDRILNSWQYRPTMREVCKYARGPWFLPAEVPSGEAFMARLDSVEWHLRAAKVASTNACYQGHFASIPLAPIHRTV